MAQGGNVGCAWALALKSIGRATIGIPHTPIPSWGIFLVCSPSRNPNIHTPPPLLENFVVRFIVCASQAAPEIPTRRSRKEARVWLGREKRTTSGGASSHPNDRRVVGPADRPREAHTAGGDRALCMTLYPKPATPTPAVVLSFFSTPLPRITRRVRLRRV